MKREHVGGLTAWRGEIGRVEVLVSHSGIGLAAAERATRRLLEMARPVWVISAGYGGGLRPALRIGEVLLDSRGWEVGALPEGCLCGTIASHAEALESPAAKTAFAKSTGALAVDMESAAISAVCAESGVPMIVVRGISDALEDALPVPLEQWFDLRAQRPRPGALLVFLATHPGAIIPFARFVRRLPEVRGKLTGTLMHLIPRLPPAP